jgi:lactate dehydrogenase-like 2-hydroxyacid dehydrogenase
VKPKALLATALPDHVRAMLEEELDLIVYEGPGRAPREWLLGLLPTVPGILTSNQIKIDNELIDRCPDLKIVSNFGVGYDNVDIPYASRKRLLVCNTPGVLSDAVADLTLGFIIDLARGVIQANAFTKAGDWGRRPPLPLGRDLKGATLGILGLGRIGHIVAYRAQAFGMRILYFDPIRDPAAEQNGLAEFAARDEVFRQADFLTVHVFLDESTLHAIGRREFELMKPSAYFINTSRGPVVDQVALTEALKAGTIAGAALDVFEKEPVDPNDPLLSLPNLIATPHIASAAVDTRIAMAELAARNLIAALNDQEPETMVNPEVRLVRQA